jgi:hypothetical protein
MEMTDNLPCLPASVDHDAVTGLDSLGFGHSLGGDKHLGRNIRCLFVKRVQGVKMPFGDD